MIRNVLLAISFALGVTFMVETARRGQTTEGDGASATLKAIGPAGFISFFVRVVLNFQLAAVFTADVTLYMLRKLQRQVRAFVRPCVRWFVIWGWGGLCA